MTLIVNNLGATLFDLDSLSDLELLGRWRSTGDPEAFEVISARHRPMVFATSRRILNNHADAEDVVQECFEILAHGDSAPLTNLPAWLHRVATHRAQNWIRGESRRNAREYHYGDLHDSATTIELDDVTARIDTAIAALPNSQAEALVAHYFENRSHREIAHSLGVSRQTVTYRIGRGVQKLRRELEKDGVVVGAAVVLAALTAFKADAAEFYPRGFDAKREGIAVQWWIAAAVVVLSIGAVIVANFARTTPAVSSTPIVETLVATEPSSEMIASETVTSVSQENGLVRSLTPSSPIVIQAASIAGDVRGHRGQPIEGAQVTLAPIDAFTGSTGAVVSVITDQGGEFLFDEVRMTGAVVVCANVAGYASASRALVLEPEIHARRYAANFQLEEGTSLRGIVVTAAGIPAPGVAVFVLAQELDSGAYGFGNHRFAAITGKDGTFSLGLPGPGAAILRLQGERLGAVPVLAEFGARDLAEYRLRNTVAVEGALSEPIATPLAGAFVELRGTIPSLEEGGEVISVLTYSSLIDDAGAFNFDAVVPGADFFVGMRSIASGEALSRAVPIDLRSSPIRLDLGPLARVQGTIHDPEGRPLKHTHVAYGLSDATVDPFLGARTDDEGHFSIALFDAGEYVFWPEYDLGTAVALRDVRHQSLRVVPGEAYRLDFTIPTPVSLEAMAVDIEGLAIPDAGVEIWTLLESGPTRYGTGRPEFTDAQGRYRWPSFPAETESWLVFRKPGFVSNHTEHLLGNAGDVVVAEAVLLPRSGGIEAQLTDLDGTSIAFAELRITMDVGVRNQPHRADGFSIRSRTDADGLLSVTDGLPDLPGILHVHAHPLGLPPFEVSIAFEGAIPDAIIDLGILTLAPVRSAP